MTTVDDKTLFERITSRRDGKAFDQLFRRYYARLLAFASQYVSENDAENVVQDVMTHLWENAGSIHLQHSVSTYLFTAVKYRCLTLISRGQVRQKVLSNLRMTYLDEVAVSSVSNHVHYAELRALYSKTLEQMPAPQRETFLMSRYDDMTYEEIARAQNVSVKTVEYRISQVLKRLQEVLSEFIP